jgi:hypothetical protein
MILVDPVLVRLESVFLQQLLTPAKSRSLAIYYSRNFDCDPYSLDLTS